MPNLRKQWDTIDHYFYLRFRTLMQERGLDPQDLEDANIISRQQVNNYLNRDNIPNLRTACRIAEFFDVSLDWLCGLDDESSQDKAADVYKEFGMRPPDWDIPPWKR